MVCQQTNVYGARITRKHTLSIQKDECNTFRENAGRRKFSLCDIKSSYFTVIIIIIKRCALHTRGYKGRQISDGIETLHLETQCK